MARTLLAVDAAAADDVARALGEELRGDSPAADDLLALLSGMGPGARSAVPALIEVLGWPSRNEEDVPNPAEACAQLGQAFQRELRAKRAAASIVGHVGAKDAAAALKALASHKDARLRYRVAVALRRIGAG